jgi:hypothetical protein
MEFLKIHNCTHMVNQLALDDTYQHIVPHYEFYGIQSDVKDYHVFRVIKGNYNSDDADVYTVEYTQLSRDDIKSEIPRRVMMYDVEENALENWSCDEYPTLEQAIARVTSNGYYELVG